mmetsp:Transcript_21252/g.26976  ORF Transcript_21252/g.26976 Transcript_21252/m.26976 type:complete len:91 (-) Transcript_21252:36-308(-)
MPSNTAIFQVEHLEKDGFLAVCDELGFVIQTSTLADLKATLEHFLGEDEGRSFTLPLSDLRPGRVDIKYSLKQNPLSLQCERDTKFGEGW